MEETNKSPFQPSQDKRHATCYMLQSDRTKKKTVHTLNYEKLNATQHSVDCTYPAPNVHEKRSRKECEKRVMSFVSLRYAVAEHKFHYFLRTIKSLMRFHNLFTSPWLANHLCTIVPCTFCAWKPFTLDITQIISTYRMRLSLRKYFL